MAVVTEVLEGGLVRHYSDQDMYIRNDRTDELYVEAIDLATSGYTYTETDIPIDTEEEATVEDYQAALEQVGVEL